MRGSGGSSAEASSQEIAPLPWMGKTRRRQQRRAIKPPKAQQQRLADSPLPFASAAAKKPKHSHTSATLPTVSVVRYTHWYMSTYGVGCLLSNTDVFAMFRDDTCLSWTVRDPVRVEYLTFAVPQHPRRYTLQGAGDAMKVPVALKEKVEIARFFAGLLRTEADPRVLTADAGMTVWSDDADDPATASTVVRKYRRDSAGSVSFDVASLSIEEDAAMFECVTDAATLPPPPPPPPPLELQWEDVDEGPDGATTRTLLMAPESTVERDVDLLFDDSLTLTGDVGCSAEECASSPPSPAYDVDSMPCETLLATLRRLGVPGRKKVAKAVLQARLRAHLAEHQCRR
eukprot:Rhum_TRINITY_DN12844_c0_g1::Rhum_TRINITY_DN12844_c0_g1_i1::g.54587::m.54587